MKYAGGNTAFALQMAIDGAAKQLFAKLAQEQQMQGRSVTIFI